MPHTFLEHSHYPRQRQDHLDVGIGFGGKPAELLHGALLVNLISFLHSDSPFSWKKNFPEAITPRGVRVATFYGLPGNFLDFINGGFGYMERCRSEFAYFLPILCTHTQHEDTINGS